MDYYNKILRDNSNICSSCAIKDACSKGTVGSTESRQKASRSKWNNPEFREKVTRKVTEQSRTDEFRKSQSDKTKRLWADEQYAQKISDSVRSAMNDDTKKKISESLIKKWKNNEIREKYAVARSRQVRISGLQIKLYSYLDDLGMDYEIEGPTTTIGYYVFDCLIPKQNGMSKNLLIECQGDCWHQPEMDGGADKRKFTYIDRYFPEYEIMYLWEHEFSTKDRVLNRLRSKLGIDINVNDFDFSDVQIRLIEYSECSKFLDAYHYIGKGRGGIAIGAFIDSELIGCIVYSSKIRQNQDFGDNFRELSRLCIHPCFQKKNFATWFIARTYQFLDVKLIISFCDMTAGHTGTVYKASNFRLHHEVRPDYWYVDQDGYVMHKKTLYSKAVNLGMTESQYAHTYNFNKRYGGKKLCFIREIK